MGNPALKIEELSERELREQEYCELFQMIHDVSPKDFNDAARQLCLNDLYFLMTEILGRADMRKDWLFDRCNEVQEQPDGMLDLWSREHYKSTIITFGKTIQDILLNPETTIGIFSHTRPIAKAFLAQIKRELESNDLLKRIFPDILWMDPKKEAPQWSLDGGITVKRKSNPKEATVEAWGLVDGQPTSKHYDILIYDDVVTRESVYTPEMIQKTTEAWELSLNLGARGGVRRTIGTRYHANDTYKVMMDRKSAIPRIYPATWNGKADGYPILLDRDELAKKRADMGSYTFSCQMLQNPTADATNGFKEEWLKYWNAATLANLNLYLLVDSAGSKKKKGNDYSVFSVIGLGGDGNYYTVDMVRDRLNLTERARMLFYLHRKYNPIGVGYEEYGVMADIEYCQEKMELENYRFHITPLGGKIPKEERIRRLVPYFETGRWYIPQNLIYETIEKKRVNLTHAFKFEEFLTFPVSEHDDMLDCMSRIFEPELCATLRPRKATATTTDESEGFGGHV